MPRLLARVLMGMVLVLFLAGTARPQALAGKVVAIAGSCAVETAGRKSALKLGAPVHVADIIETAGTAKLKLRMNDGSILSVAAGTRMTVSAYTLDAAGKRDDVELSLGQGLLRAVVAPVNHPTTFEVKTATGTAAVRSTDWFIEAKPDNTEVAVLRGSVTLTSSATGVTVTIPAHDSASVAAGRDPTDPKPMRMAGFYALVARTTIAAPRSAPRAEPDEEYNPQPEGAPPPPPGYGMPPDQGPPPGAYGPPPDGGYGYGGPDGGFGLGIGGRPGGGGFNGGGGRNGGGGNEGGGRNGGNQGSPSRGR